MATLSIALVLLPVICCRLPIEKDVFRYASEMVKDWCYWEHKKDSLLWRWVFLFIMETSLKTSAAVLYRICPVTHKTAL